MYFCHHNNCVSAFHDSLLQRRQKIVQLEQHFRNQAKIHFLACDRRASRDEARVASHHFQWNRSSRARKKMTPLVLLTSMTSKRFVKNSAPRLSTQKSGGEFAQTLLGILCKLIEALEINVPTAWYTVAKGPVLAGGIGPF
jgi:hypothetical protein